MAIEVRSVGGYNEVGKNMTAIRVGNEVVILDMGLHLENYIRLTEEEDVIKFGVKDLTDAGAIPNIEMIDDWRALVAAIVPTHAHLDHVGAIPYLAKKFTAPVIATPFTCEVIEAILRDEKIKLKNEIKRLNVNCSMKMSDECTIEFVNGTHSTPQTAIAAIHGKEGTVIYANDFKFDHYPTLGKKPNIERLRELGKEGVHALIVDSTYAWDERKMPSESVAREMLKDVLLGTDSKGQMIICSTFSSHLPRLKSIIDYGKKLGRRVVFMGRSLAKYVEAGEKAGIINFSEDVEVVKYARQVRRRLKEISKNRAEREKHLIVVTGHQGEPRAVLSRMARGELEFEFRPGDHVVFSCTIIPTDTNKANRKELEAKLKAQGVRIFKDIHVSGHAAREDLRDLINLLKPKYLIPAHGTLQMTSALVDLARDMGYESKHIQLLQNGDRLKLE